MPERLRFVALLAFALIAAGAWRLAVVVGASPMLGFANQFDMARTSACIGLWPDLPEPARFAAHPQAPLSRYVRREEPIGECYLSSELVFAAPLRAFTAPGSLVDLRWIGATKAALLVALAVAFAVTLRHRPAWMLAHATLFALVVCDPLNALWMNTLYTEFAALFFAYAAIVMLVMLGARDRLSAPPSTGLVAAFALSLAGLGLSRQQHVLLPAVLALPAVLSLWRPAPRATVAIVAMVCAVPLLQFGFVDRSSSIAAANNVDTVLGTILPASLNPTLTAQRLGLPEHCLQASGATWYVQMGESVQATCPEVLAIRRSRQALLLITEPATMLRATLRGMPQLQDWRLGYMGVVEGGNFDGIDAVQNVAGVAATSIAPRVTALPPSVFLFLLTAALALLAVSATVSLVALTLERRAPLSLVIFALTATAWYAIATAIGGDGYVEVSRHAQLAATGLLSVAVLLIAAMFAPLLVLVDGRARLFTLLAAVGYAVSALGIAVPLQLPLHRVMAAIPMAIGVVDRPTQNIVTGGAVEIAGWALDPLGVAAVEIVSGDGKVIGADLGLPYAGARGESLALYYPSYPQTASAGFVAKLPARLFDHGAVDVRTSVVNAAGVRTEIDRRRLVPAAR